MKKSITFAVGLIMMASPLLANAQVTSQSSLSPAVTNQLIVLYTQLIQILKQEIAILVARQQGQQTPPVQQNTAASLSASPTTGSSPLAVTFNASQLNIASNYVINFGDGSSQQIVKGNCIGITAVQGGQGGIKCASTATHTYQNGTYTATLLSGACSGGTYDTCAVPNKSESTVTIQVGTSTTATSTATH